MLVAILYEYNTLLIRNMSHDQERLCNAIRYLAAWFSRHATGPISSSTALRDSRMTHTDKDLHIAVTGNLNDFAAKNNLV